MRKCPQCNKHPELEERPKAYVCTQCGYNHEKTSIADNYAQTSIYELQTIIQKMRAENKEIIKIPLKKMSSTDYVINMNEVENV